MTLIHSIELANGQVWSAVLQKNRILKIISKNDSPNVSALFYNADQYLDRYNMPDTLKGQHISKLSTGSGLHSDMGRLMASLVDSNLDWHDPVCGLSTQANILKSFGKKSFAEVRNDAYKNGFDNILTEIGKHGLGLKDIVPNINFFSKVFVNEDGTMHYQSNHAKTDAYVSLRTDMKLLTVLSNTPHPFHPKGPYPGGAIKIEIYEGPTIEPTSDVCLQSRPENFRAWENTQTYLTLSE